MSNGKDRNKAVFFDRDGTLNWPAMPGEYIRTPEDLRLLPGAAVAVRKVREAGFAAILATNQRWLSEPGIDPNVYVSIEFKLSRLLAEEDAKLDGSYTCSHSVGRCDCRKPLPGMLLQAAAELGLSLVDSYFVGDSVTDAEAGTAAGVTSILISPGQTANVSSQAAYVVPNVEEAVEVILNAICPSEFGGRDPLGVRDIGDEGDDLLAVSRLVTS